MSVNNRRQIAGRQKMETMMGLPHLDDTYAEQAFQCLIPKECHCDEQFSVHFTPIRDAYDNTYPHGEGMCTQAGGRRALP